MSLGINFASARGLKMVILFGRRQRQGQPQQFVANSA